MRAFPKPSPMSREEAAKIFKPGWKAPLRDECPPEAMYDLQHPWWDFLDQPPAQRKRRIKQHIFGELVP